MRNMREWKLGQDGFVMNYMLAGPCVTEFHTEIRDPNQLALEARLRREIVTEKGAEKDCQVKMGETAKCGGTWTAYYSHGNYFVDRSAFYSTLQRIDMDVAAVLCVPEDMQVQAVLWTYMAVAVYCNGMLVEHQDTPAYKPIRRKTLTLPLNKGQNLIYLQCENLGVRDTRNLVGLQILDCRDKISVRLADEDCQEEIWRAEDFLDHLQVDGDKVIFPGKAPAGAECYCPVISPDYEKVHKPELWQSVAGQAELVVPSDKIEVQVRMNAAGCRLVRKLEFASRMKPKYVAEGTSHKDNYELIMERIAAVHSLNRKSFGFGMANVLARKYKESGWPCREKKGDQDRELLLDTLRLIEQRVDCADFILCGLLRYMHEYGLDDELRERTKEVLLHFRYWMTMDGADAMCFWSENHALLFYTCAMEAGRMYPQEYFSRAAMTGEELSRYGRGKVLEWLDDVEQYGFEEFMSAVYMCITFMALVHLVDYGDENISKRAAAVTDQMLSLLCRHSFKECVVAPMGRVYRDVIYPFAGGTQALLNLIDPAAPYTFGEGWLGCYATSHYRFPEGLKEMMAADQEISYESGNAVIKLEKNEDYCLTSVQCLPEYSRRWANIQKQPGADVESHEYVKSLNECFHGTTWLVPGIYGYQQHLWYGALDGETVIFVNHPGAACDASGMRPGYWYGNGVLPALKQEQGMIGMIYRIPQEHPIHFTHVYCPEERFDQVVRKGQWLFFRKGQGYMALWCSDDMTDYDDIIFGCEKRVYGDAAAYLCVCRRGREYASFQKFIEEMLEIGPEFDEESDTLKVNGQCFLRYEAGLDETQYVE